MAQKGNMYEWAKPWNPLGGKCMHDCSYCSTNNFRRFPNMEYKYSGDPRLFSDLYKKFPGESKIIFVVGQNDLFANNVPTAIVKRVIDQCNIWNQHTYFFQTKNPDRYFSFLPDFPKKSILCTTIETNRYYPQMGFAPITSERAEAMYKITGYEKQVTIEPIIDFNLKEMVALIKMCHPSKVNIGADSKNNHLPEPSKEKLLALIDELQKFTIIDRKTNLSRLLK
jgi:DNA repair photolyase